MKNIKRYTEHLKESRKIPEELGQRLIKILDYIKTPDIEEVKALIEAGADLGAKNKNGWTSLHYAAYHGHTEAVKALIGAGAALEARDEVDRTPLHFAATRRRAQIVRILIKAGADLEARDEKDQTPLHYATLPMGYTDAIKALIKAGANLEAKDIDGRTPLHNVAERGFTEVARIFIKAGADVSTAFDSLDKLEDLFGGDISWIPQESLPPEWRKRQRARGAFGRF